MRLIDCDAVERYIDCGHLRPPTEKCFSELDVVRMLGKFPTIDAVPVIRCLACAWRSSTGFCGRHGHPVSDDFFCAHGTTEIIKKAAPAKKAEKKTEERCMATGLACSRCVPGPCDHRRLEIK